MDILKRMWGGGFKEKPSNKLIKFTTWTDIEGAPGADYFLYKYAIASEYAYIIMLMEGGIIDRELGKRMLSILNEIKDTEPDLRGYEDVHTYIEEKIIEELGYTPHICRSRNDQIVTIERLYIREYIIELSHRLERLIETLFKISIKYRDTIIPLYTHRRQADISTYGHLTLSYVEALLRIYRHLVNLYNIVNSSPYGAGAIAGCILPIDRVKLADLLGFDNLDIITIDATSSRGEYISHYIYSLAIIMKNLSRIAEDLIYYSLDEIKVIKISEEYVTGSSSLPHKKNPDPLELIIGKADKISGYTGIIFSIGWGVSGYRREMQEMKHIMVIATLDTLYSLDIMTDILENIDLDREKAISIINNNLVAPELANYIAFKYKLSFRDVHKIIGEYLSRYKKIDLDRLEKFMAQNGINIKLDSNELQWLNSFRKIIEMKKIIGGPGDYENSFNILMMRFKKLRRLWKVIYNRYGKWIEKLSTAVKEYTG